jgi:hypothetical protein
VPANKNSEKYFGFLINREHRRKFTHISVVAYFDI